MKSGKNGTRHKTIMFAADFETTVYNGQTDTEVWSAAVAELGTDKEGLIFHSLPEFFDFLVNLKRDIVLYFHNLKFDGSFWLDYFLRNQDFSLGALYDGETVVGLKRPKSLCSNEYTYSISAMGQWYTFAVKVGGHLITMKDSLKLIPFSLEAAAEAFNTPHRKLQMEYEGRRYAGCPIYENERAYILNDVYVLREILQFMFDNGHDRLTIGSCCLAEFKASVKEKSNARGLYGKLFPNLYEYKIVSNYGSLCADAYVRKAYRGGWTYLVPQKANKIFYCGTTADVNSLYPSVMHSDGGNYYPIGEPIFWHGNYIPEEAERKDRYYYVRVRMKFYIKDGYLPCIQIKDDSRYSAKEWLITSDIYEAGQLIMSEPVTLTLSVTDLRLIVEHYGLVDFEILDGCWFYAVKGLFDEYIDKYRSIKINSKGAMRALAKLFLVNLNGKMGASDDSSQKVATLDENGNVIFSYIEAHDKEPGYVPIGAAITSYARDFTIRAAQKNYYGADKRGFIYGDTDSLHCDLYPEELVGLPVHDAEFCHWKLETSWAFGKFVRQKAYIEYVTHENLVECRPYYNVKCSGMKKRPRDLFVASIEGRDLEKMTDEEKEFLYDTGDRVVRTIEDFKPGLEIPGNLKAHRIKGGIILKSHTFKMR